MNSFIQDDYGLTAKYLYRLVSSPSIKFYHKTFDPILNSSRDQIVQD